MRAVSPWRFAQAWPRINDRIYVAAKVATDPLYPAAFDALQGTTAPLLDVGCGMGVFAFYLRARGWEGSITGIDYDDRKIATARVVAGTLRITAEFDTADARRDLPDHSGNVTILDILQYFSPAEQRDLIRRAAARVAPGCRLVIRSALADRNWRSRLGRVTDRMAAWARWMKDLPVSYPTAAFLAEAARAAGLEGTVRPLWGRTPFNNWLGVWQRPAAGAG